MRINYEIQIIYWDICAPILAVNIQETLVLIFISYSYICFLFIYLYLCL